MTKQVKDVIEMVHELQAFGLVSFNQPSEEIDQAITNHLLNDVYGINPKTGLPYATRKCARKSSSNYSKSHREKQHEYNQRSKADKVSILDENKKLHFVKREHCERVSGTRRMKWGVKEEFKHLYPWISEQKKEV